MIYVVANCKDWLDFKPNELELNFERCLKVGSWVNVFIWWIMTRKTPTYLLIEPAASITFECNIQKRLEQSIVLYTEPNWL